MYAAYANSPVVRGMERAYDLVHVGKASMDEGCGRKRSRDTLSRDIDEEIFKDIVHELDYMDLFPTFRTLVLGKFYLLLSYNTDDEYFPEISKIVDAFKHIIRTADEIYYKSHEDERYKEELHMYLSDELKKLLYTSQQMILIFHLRARPPTAP